MEVFLEAAWICVITLAALTFLGYGLTRLVLPRSLSAEGLLWTPFVGFTLASIVYHALNIGFLNVRQATLVLFGIAAAACGLALIRGRQIAAPSPAISGCLALASVLVSFASMAPLAAIGQLTAISINHDLIDIYDAAAAYVIDYPVASILNAPPNPLASLVAGPIVLSNGWGLTYVHALASILSGRSTIETQTPVFSLMYALMIPAVYIFLRRAIVFPTWLALAASAALGVHGMLLSILLIGLGNHTVMLALLPLLLVATFRAIDERSLRAFAFAGLMLANIPLTFWAGFAFYVPPVVAYALLGPSSPLRAYLPRLADRLGRASSNGTHKTAIGVAAELSTWVHSEQELMAVATASHWLAQDVRPHRMSSPDLSAAPDSSAPAAATTPHRVPATRRRRVGLLAVVVGSVLVALPGYQRIINDMRTLSGTSAGWGGTSYSDLGLVPGLSVWAYPWAYPTPTDLREILGDPIGGAVLAAQTAAFMLAIVLAALALLRSRQPWRGRAAVASVVLSYAALLAYLRFVRPYPYGYFKAITFAALVGVPLVAEGLALVWTARTWPVGRIRVATRPAALVLAGALVSILLLNSALTIVAYSDQTPTAFRGSVLPPSSLELSAMESRIPPGASVLVSEWPPDKEKVVSAIAYFLRDHPLYGQFDTLQAELNNPPPRGEVADYGVLDATEDPLDHGFEPTDLVWSNADVKLYKRGDIVAHYGYQTGKGPTLGPGQPLQLALTPEGIAVNQDLSADSQTGVATRQLTLELGTLQAQVLKLTINGEERELRLDPGVSRYALESTSVPARVTLIPEGDTPVFVRSLSLRDTPDAPSSLMPERDILLAVPQVDVQGSTVHLGLDYAGADAWTQQMSVGVNVGGTAEPSGEWADFGWWGVNLQRSQSSLHIDLDLATRQASASTALGERPVSNSLPEIKDGDYVAKLGFWESAQASLGWQSPTYDLFAFRVRDGQVESPQGRAGPVLFLPWRTSYTATDDAMAPFQSEVTAIGALIPSSSEVMLGPGLRGSPSAVAALVHSLTGVTFAADFLAGAEYVQATRVYDFAILDPKEDPAPLGYRPQDRLLAMNDFAVYRRGEALAHLDLRGKGGYPRLEAGQSLSFQATADAVTMAPAQDNLLSAADVKRGVTLEFGSLAPSQVVVTVGDGSPRFFQVPAGVTRYATEAVDVPTTISVTGAGSEAAFLLGVDLDESAGSTARLVLDPNTMLVSTRLESDGGAKLGVDVRWAGGGDDAVQRFFMGVNLNGNSVPDNQWFAGSWWGLQMADRNLHLDLDLDTLTGAAAGHDGPIPVASRLYAARDGDYQAEMSLWEHDLSSRGWPTPFIPLFTSHVRDGHVTQVVPEDTPLAVVPLVAPADSATPLPDAGPITSMSAVDERFVGNAPGWPNSRDATAWLTRGAYHMVARTPGQFVAIGAPVPSVLRDVEVSATFQKIGGPPGGGYGLILRDQGPGPRDGLNQEGRYYVLEAGEGDKVGIWRRDGDIWTDLVSWRSSAAVHPGGAVNELVARAVGDRLSLMVNGMEAAAATDTSLRSGSVGAFVGGDFNQVVLEHFVVRTP